MSSKPKRAAPAASSSKKKKSKLDPEALPSLDHLTLDQTKTILHQLLLDSSTVKKTRSLIKRVVEEPERVAQVGLIECVQSIQRQISTLADELERAWEEEMEFSVGAGDSRREDWETESGPEIASALLPTLLPLILSLPSSHSTTPSVLEMTYSTLLYAASVALSCRGSPCQTSGFIKTVDEELVKLIDLRAKGGEEGWSARRELERLEEEVKDYGEDWEEDGCPFDRAVERLKELGKGEEKGEATPK